MSSPSGRVHYRPLALRDIEQQVRHYAQGVELGRRFVNAVLDTAGDLDVFPSRGAPAVYAWARRLRLRSIRVAGFPTARIYYRSTTQGIIVSRVLDSRRNLNSEANPK